MPVTDLRDVRLAGLVDDETAHRLVDQVMSKHRNRAHVDVAMFDSAI